MTRARSEFPVVISLGILAWNEEDSIGPMLASLFEQSIFARLAARGQRCEIVCLANGCTDRTVAVATEIFEKMEREHPACDGLKAWVADIPQPGRNNAWNRFVHEFSASETKFIGLMDADIIFNRPDTLQLVLEALESDPHLDGASDWPVKNISLKANPSFRERVSLSTSQMTGNIAGRINGMMYCFRTNVARNLYLPRDVVANDDGFFKAAICTDFFRAPLDPTKVVSVRNATHLYEPYLTAKDVINNQKRQMIGQTTVHVIIGYLNMLPESDRAHLAETLKRHEAQDPDWLKKLINAHLAEHRHFWQIFPDVLSFRWKRWAQLPGLQRIKALPATIVGFFITLIACHQASKFLRRGVSTYWPKVARQTIAAAPVVAK